MTCDDIQSLLADNVDTTSWVVLTSTGVAYEGHISMYTSTLMEVGRRGAGFAKPCYINIDHIVAIVGN